MGAGRTITVLALVLTAMIVSTTVAAYEIYHWLDDNGVPNFSQKQPAGKMPGVTLLTLTDTTPSDYDPEEDRYGVQAQAERLSTLREEMQQHRDAVRERRGNTAPRQFVQYREPVRYYSPSIPYPLIYPRPPQKPQPPIAVPSPTDTLELPGRAPN